jgi:hypothetical protein
MCKLGRRSDSDHWIPLRIPMNVRSEPEVRPALDPGEPARSLKSKVKQGYKIPKAGGQFRIPGVGRVETLHHRSPEIAKCETLKSRKKEDNFGYWELEESRLFIIRSPGSCEM